jgi:hypothetical protein
MSKCVSYLVLLFLLSCQGRISAADAPAIESPIKSDEEVVFFPTRAWQTDPGPGPDSDWDVEIHGWIFEPGESDPDPVLLKQLTGIDLEALQPTELLLLKQRAALFTVDNERGKAIPIRIGERVEVLPKSEANGHFQGQFHLTAAEVLAIAGEARNQLSYRAVMRPGDERLIQGTVHLIPRPAVHVVSDIDDTIKVSQVRDKPELLMNTFCRPFRPAPGMAELYRKWDAKGVRFHYVSASPWQLYPPLAEFIREHQFPGGTFAMKPFRIQDGTALNVLGTQNTYKRSIIEPLIQQFPQDQFVLIGDTGEQDPEIFARLAADYPQVVRVFLRNVTDQTPADFQKLFEMVPADRWQLFREPAEFRWSPTAVK